MCCWPAKADEEAIIKKASGKTRSVRTDCIGILLKKLMRLNRKQGRYRSDTVGLARHDPRRDWCGGSMKAICAAFGLAAMCAVGLGAQSATTKTKTKIDVKDGKEITVGGCLESNPGGGYMLTTTNGSMKYALITDDDLSKHLGHRVEVKGK